MENVFCDAQAAVIYIKYNNAIANIHIFSNKKRCPRKIKIFLNILFQK